jgi:hypothetical protein
MKIYYYCKKKKKKKKLVEITVVFKSNLYLFIYNVLINRLRAVFYFIYLFIIYILVYKRKKAIKITRYVDYINKNKSW